MNNARFGLTWWGRRWIAALESLGAVYANRLPRGRTYARGGRVADLTVTPGQITASVEGSRARPYRVRIRLPVFDEDTWERVTAALAAELRHAAALLDGQMPTDIDEVLDTCGVSLFPRSRELDTSCSCPDYANPCKHVAAVHYVLAQTFDADPFLLPTLRGRNQTALLAGLRAARSGVAEPAPAPDTDSGTIPLTRLTARELFTARGDLARVTVHPHPATDPSAALRRLGPPPTADECTDVLLGLVAAAAQTAWNFLTEPDDAGTDPLLATLRACEPATSSELAEALNLDITEVRARLAKLIADGDVTRTGHARTTRYHIGPIRPA
jgi:uncharacterized Zn finger protein